ncbi:MAG TPA: PaaI family thioesterase [Bradyrhizobium sp.]|nr:PaaI family thioesterase [Bradyrhizobium sp.]
MSLERIDAPDIPAGFNEIAFSARGDFIELVGPLYGGRTENGKSAMGFRVEQRHCHSGKTCNGGMLLTLADILLPVAIQRDAGYTGGFLVTVSLSADFLRPAPMGSWVDGVADVLSNAGRLRFCQCIIRSDRDMAVRVSAVFKETRTKVPYPPLEF